MFWENFRVLCAQKGMSPSAVAKKIGYTSATVTGWKQGVEPHERTKRKVAEYFGITVEELVGPTMPGESTPDPELDQLLESLKNDPQRRMMFHLLDGATADEVRAAVEIVDVLMRKLRPFLRLPRLQRLPEHLRHGRADRRHAGAGAAHLRPRLRDGHRGGDPQALSASPSKTSHSLRKNISFFTHFSRRHPSPAFIFDFLNLPKIFPSLKKHNILWFSPCQYPHI